MACEEGEEGDGAVEMVVGLLVEDYPGVGGLALKWGGVGRWWDWWHDVKQRRTLRADDSEVYMPAGTI